MIPPLSDDEYNKLIPGWAKAIDSNPERDKITTGMRVYDVLYGPREGDPFGTVEMVSTGVLRSPIRGSLDTLRVRHDDGRISIVAAAGYYVPVPPEHDKDTAQP